MGDERAFDRNERRCITQCPLLTVKPTLYVADHDCAVGTDRLSPKRNGLAFGAARHRRDTAGSSRTDEHVKPIGQHGFTIVDFTPDKIVLRHFKWDWKTQPVEQMDTLPFHQTELVRPI